MEHQLDRPCTTPTKSDRLSVRIVIFFACLTCGNYAQAQSSNFYTPVSTQGQYLQDLSYGYDPFEVLDVCRPDSNKGPYPGLIMVHGGGWTSGHDNGLMDDWCREFSTFGYVVADISYRLDSPVSPNPEWPAFQIGDVQLAIRWMRYHAKELNLDPNRLCGYGTSAGAYLVVFASTQQRIYSSDVDWIAPSLPVGLSCVVDGFGPVDFTVPTFQPKLLTELLGVSYQENPALYKMDSPVFYVNARTPPSLVIYGTKDSIVPPSQSVEFVEALRKFRITAKIVTYDGEHAYKGLNAKQLGNIFNQIEFYLRGCVGN